MGSRKDILKNLGIPEYPWSSDDDEPPADSRPTVPPRPAGQQQPPPANSAQATAGRSQPQTRELYLSLLNHTSPRNEHNIASTSSGATNNRSDLPLAYMARTTHTPAPELRERSGTGAGAGAGQRNDADIQRVLAFKRLTRNMLSSSAIGRYSRFGYTIPRYSGNARPGSVVPSELASMSMRLPPWRRGARNQPTNNIPGSARQIIVDHQQAGPSSARRRRTHSMDVQNSDDDDMDEPNESTSEVVASTAESASLPAAEHPTVQETEADEEAQGSVPSNDTSGVSLEEEMVQIAEEPTTVNMDLIDRARAVMPSSNDPNLASTSRSDEVDVLEMEAQSVQGVKRKRRNSSDDKPSDPLTVKQFNQSLLRLLECPVCLEWMEPPMSQCRRGHLVCNRCRTRLASCPVCRTTFSSVRNRAMEGVADMLRYPCRHGCGREVRLRRRTPHEASCLSRKYMCPAPLCADKQPMPRTQLSAHFHSKHLHLLKMGRRHRFGIKVNSEAHDTWIIMALDEFFHMKVDVDIRTWGVIVYVSYIGPKCNAKDYTYEVSIDGQHNERKIVYRRATHSDLESCSLNVSRQDCFHLTLDQALNFIRFKNRHCDAERFLEFDVEINKIEPAPSRDDSDS